MRILLFGEYSNVHHTLCEALRRAGHEVLLISDGDGWKNYPRDVDLRRRQQGPIGSLRYLSQLAALLPKLRGYDVVQIINPVFLDVKSRWNKWVFDYLKKHNRMVSVGCFGDDYYVISRMLDDKYLAYTDFYAAGHKIEHEVNQHRIANWLYSDKAALTQYVMAKADCLIPCLYEYWKVYETPEFHAKLHYIPLPVDITPFAQKVDKAGPIHVLFASQKRRGQMKGTDHLEPLFDRLAKEYPDKISLKKIVSVPFTEYQRLVAEADVVIDQLYSFTPAMAALECMSQGKVVISGFEPEYAQFIGYQGEAPLINLCPYADEQNYATLVSMLTDAQKIAQLKESSRAYVSQYHDADRVAKQYVEVWQKVIASHPL